MDISALSQKIAFRVDEAVRATGLGRSYLYEEMKSGALPSFKAGRRRLIMATALMAYMEARQTSSALPQA